MSEFTSKIISWKDSNLLKINCPLNTAYQDLFGFIIGYALQKGSLEILDLGCGNGSYSLINFDNGHFFNPKEWKRNYFGRLLAKFTPIKRYYQDFVDVEKIIEFANEIGMNVDDYIDYHIFINKKRLKILNQCDEDIRGQLIDKIQIFEKEISNLMNIKNNNLVHNKYIYSSTLV